MSPFRLASAAWKHANDLWLGIDTIAPPAGAAPTTRHRDNYAFASVDYWDLRKILNRIAPTAEDVVYEIGAGLGRVACLFARYPVRKVVAIELNPGNCERVTQNARTLRGRRCPIEVRSEDAAQAHFADGTIFFLYNPFGPDTLSDVLSNIRISCLVAPHRVRLVYVNPLAGHREVFARQTWLADEGRTKTLHGLDVLFFRAAT